MSSSSTAVATEMTIASELVSLVKSDANRTDDTVSSLVSVGGR